MQLAKAMGTMSFKDLVVWQRSVELAQSIYQAADLLPQREAFGLRSQMCRAAISIPSNIAEGRRRGTRKDFLHFLRIADGSAAELETQIIIAEKVYPRSDFERARKLLVETQKMLGGMIKRLELPPAS